MKFAFIVNHVQLHLKRRMNHIFLENIAQTTHVTRSHLMLHSSPVKLKVDKILGRFVLDLCYTSTSPTNWVDMCAAFDRPHLSHEWASSNGAIGFKIKWADLSEQKLNWKGSRRRCSSVRISLIMLMDIFLTISSSVQWTRSWGETKWQLHWGIFSMLRSINVKWQFQTGRSDRSQVVTDHTFSFSPSFLCASLCSLTFPSYAKSSKYFFCHCRWRKMVMDGWMGGWVDGGPVNTGTDSQLRLTHTSVESFWWRSAKL